MKIRKGDKVRVISGSYKGKEGVVKKIFPKVGKIVVENINVCKRHQKSNRNNSQGGILNIYAPIYASKVSLIDGKSNKTCKIGYKIINGVKTRINKKTGEKIEIK